MTTKNYLAKKIKFAEELMDKEIELDEVSMEALICAFELDGIEINFQDADRMINLYLNEDI